MKKSFPFEVPGRKPARVVDAIKHDLRKYVKRERRKALPEGVDYCAFDCRLGRDESTSAPVHLTQISKGIDAAAQEGWPSVYIEILAKPGYRTSDPNGKNTQNSSD